MAQGKLSPEGSPGCFTGEYPDPLEILSSPPHSTQSILLFGRNLDPWLAAASQQDWQVIEVCPDSFKSITTTPYKDKIVILPPSSWESLTLPDGGYATILLHQAMRYVNPLVVLGKAYQMLEEAGTFIWVDEIAVAGFKSGYDGRPRLSYLLTLAERCGFILQEQRELPPDLIDEQADGRDDAEGKQVALILLRFTKRTDMRWRVSHVDPRDFPAVADLFRRVFHQEMSPQLWDWKYGKGRGQGSLAWADDRVVAHYGGITRSIRYRGRPEKACQVADVMVDQTERGVLTRKGPFFLTAASLPEACCGYGSKHLIGFGFPNARAMQVAARQGLYAEVGRIMEVYWSPDPSPRSFLTQLRRITDRDQNKLEEITNPLWQAMSADLNEAIIGIRDGEWLRYRYLFHPHHDYHVLLISNRLTRKSHGIMVLRKDGERCELLDVIAPLKHIPLLIRQARDTAKQWGASELYCWISTSYASLFAQCAGQQRDPDVATPTSIWTDAPSPDELRNRWWLMSGDTDFH